MSYPPPRYEGEDGLANARLRPAGMEPERSATRMAARPSTWRPASRPMASSASIGGTCRRPGAGRTALPPDDLGVVLRDLRVDQAVRRARLVGRTAGRLPVRAGRRHPWPPERVGRRCVDADPLRAGRASRGLFETLARVSFGESMTDESEPRSCSATIPSGSDGRGRPVRPARTDRAFARVRRGGAQRRAVLGDPGALATGVGPKLHRHPYPRCSSSSRGRRRSGSARVDRGRGRQRRGQPARRGTRVRQQWERGTATDRDPRVGSVRYGVAGRRRPDLDVEEARSAAPGGATPGPGLCRPTTKAPPHA